MKFSLRYTLVISFLFFAALSSQAQSLSELRAKYGSPTEAYEIRPHILMTVKYAEEGQVCEYVIEARHTSKDGVRGESLIQRNTANEIIDEVVPISLRGRLINRISFNGGCSGISFERYEQVEIQTSGTCSSTEGNGIDSIIIRWKNHNCPKE